MTLTLKERLAQLEAGNKPATAATAEARHPEPVAAPPAGRPNPFKAQVAATPPPTPPAPLINPPESVDVDPGAPLEDLSKPLVGTTNEVGESPAPRRGRPVGSGGKPPTPRAAPALDQDWGIFGPRVGQAIVDFLESVTKGAQS